MDGGLKLTFLGAADTVTGSRYLVEYGSRRVLVDCGLFQGLKVLRERNRARFAVAPSSIDAVVLTHAHLDHTGYLPVLVRDGFSGPIYCTAPTAALCGLLLPDAAHLEEEAAERANRHGYSRHAPALPLFTGEDAARALALLEPVPFEEEVAAAGTLRFRYRPAGHILGAASVLLDTPGGSILFSGDVGRASDEVLLPPRNFEEADWVLVESTYGDRLHAAEPPREVLRRVILETVRRGGVVVIPSFAVGRAQALLYHLTVLRDSGELPEVPLFIDSPMAARATALLFAADGEHRLTPEQCERMRRAVTITASVEESKAIDRRLGPMIIISASGMATGGRVLFHLERFGDDARNTILLIGYQAAGTRGAALQGGARSLRMHGREVEIHARVETVSGLSAHADADELMSWLRQLRRRPEQVFMTHGEPAAADALRARVKRDLGWRARVPEHGETVALMRRQAPITRA
jgi:metallo-beta-lactamase family protein